MKIFYLQLFNYFLNLLKLYSAEEILLKKIYYLNFKKDNNL